MVYELSKLIGNYSSSQIAESLPPLLMERAGERRIKQTKMHFLISSPYPLPLERDSVLRAE
jgi:hypothetical protein